LTTDPADDYSPRWSPDGRFIAFLRDLTPEKAAVLLIPALGGPERKVAEIVTVAPGVDLPGPFLAWSPDGKSLAISGRESATGPYALFLLSIESGEKQQLTSPPVQSLGDSTPAFSPDGHTLAFSRSIDFGIGDLYLLASSHGSLPAGSEKRLTFENRGALQPAWTADGREIIYSAQFGLWRIDVPGPAGKTLKAEPLASLGDNVIEPVISHGGQRLTYMHLLFHSNIWRLSVPIPEVRPDAHNGKPSMPVNRATPFLSSTRNDSAPQFSPDGRRIAFTSDRSGNIEIWVSDSDGSNSSQLTSFGGPAVSTPRWSPDGERIAFDSDATGNYDIWVVGSTGGKPQRMTTHPANDGNPSWSHDGRWIYFDSARSGQQQVWKIPANGGEAIQVTRDGGFAPLESPDGKFLFYVNSLVDASLWRIPVAGGPASKILEGVSNYINLAIVDNGVFFVPAGGTGAGSSLQFLSFATNKVRPVANFEKPLSSSGLGGVSVSPDGRWVLYTQFDQSGSELMLVENFH
jgi:Tol biopolymer transport system component